MRLIIITSNKLYSLESACDHSEWIASPGLTKDVISVVETVEFPPFRSIDRRVESGYLYNLTSIISYL